LCVLSRIMDVTEQKHYRNVYSVSRLFSDSSQARSDFIVSAH
jgi:hypothetical protein